VLPVHAEPGTAADAADRFALSSLACRKVVLGVAADGEHLLLTDGCRRLQLHCRSGRLLGESLFLRYDLSGLREAEARMATLARFLALARLGRMPAALFRPPARAARWRLALRALDAREAGASQREIAAALYGAARARADWRGDSDYLRSRVRRVVSLGEAFVEGGYRELLS
jgi:hypothetical protein